MRGPLRLGFRRVVAAAALGIVAVVATAAPASAHTVGGVNATNYRTRIRSVTPAVDGVDVRVLGSGSFLELTNHTARDVIVVGYDDDPYLRVGPRGVFENTRSPATSLNRVRRNPAPPPASADPRAAPRWHKIGNGPSVRWHDHRAHWMGTTEPPAVAQAPGTAHLVQRFRIVLRTGGHDIVVRGDVWWIPGPSPWPWIAIAAAIAVAVVVGARTKAAAPVIGSALAVALVAALVHAAGSWSADTGTALNRLGNDLPTLGAVALGVVALVQLGRRGLRAAAPLLVFAGLFLGIAVGLADVSAFSKSQLPTNLAPDLDRLTIAVALGGGLGVTVGAALHVSDRRARRARPARA